MKKFIFLILITLSLLIVFISILHKPANAPFVQINNSKFMVDVAKTEEQKEKGLDIYNKLSKSRGMIFPFQNLDYYPFWMNGMKFPIDIIYIKDNKIVDIFPNLPFPKTSTESPVIVKPTEKANYVLEINAGLSKKYNFKKGDLVIINL